MRLREVGPDAAAVCHALYLRAVREGAAAHYTEAQRRAWAPSEACEPWFVERLESGRTWLAEDEAGPAGFLTGAEREGGAAHLDLFFVRPDTRRSGVAPALYDAFDRWAGARRRTADASHFLRPFLERRGWTCLGEERVTRHGVVLSRWTMAQAAPG